MALGMQEIDPVQYARALAFALIPMILSLSVHECAHAWSARLLGDETAKDAGRLTLNPQAHIDPRGTLFVPALSVLMGGPPFLGWARPTPFRPDRLREGVPRRLGAALVSAAGPLSNVALALFSLTVLALLGRFGIPLFSMVQDGEAMVPERNALDMFLLAMFHLNIGLAFFNLLPIPPLDGYRLLPAAFDSVARPLERYGFALLMAAFLLLPAGVTGVVFRPMFALMNAMQSLFGVA